MVFRLKITSRRPLFPNLDSAQIFGAQNWPNFDRVSKIAKMRFLTVTGPHLSWLFAKIQKLQNTTFLHFCKAAAKICDVRGPDFKTSFWARDFTLPARSAESPKNSASPLAREENRATFRADSARNFSCEFSHVIANFCPWCKIFATRVCVLALLTAQKGSTPVSTGPGPGIC